MQLCAFIKLHSTDYFARILRAPQFFGTQIVLQIGRCHNRFVQSPGFCGSYVGCNHSFVSIVSRQWVELVFVFLGLWKSPLYFASVVLVKLDGPPMKPCYCIGLHISYVRVSQLSCAKAPFMSYCERGKSLAWNGNTGYIWWLASLASPFRSALALCRRIVSHFCEQKTIGSYLLDANKHSLKG